MLKKIMIIGALGLAATLVSATEALIEDDGFQIEVVQSQHQDFFDMAFEIKAADQQVDYAVVAEALFLASEAQPNIRPLAPISTTLVETRKSFEVGWRGSTTKF